MSRLEKDVFDAVQAALLNSECSPERAVQIALEAIAQFAEVEAVAVDTLLHLGEERFLELAREAWQKRPEAD